MLRLIQVVRSSFLQHITRVAAANYIPTTGAFTCADYIAFIQLCPSDDILHARIQTMGVAEHIFDVTIHGKSVTWHLYDVGGARGQRHSWIPYFDDANAIIFVAPVSAFDQASCTYRIPLDTQHSISTSRKTLARTA